MTIPEDFFNSLNTHANVAGLLDKLDTSGVTELITADVLSGIPVLHQIATLVKVGQNVQAHYYAKRMLTFLTQIESVSDEDKEAFLKKQDKKPKRQEKDGEIALQILDKLDSIQQAGMLGKAFRFLLRDRSDEASIAFNRHAHVIKNMNTYLTFQLTTHYASGAEQSSDPDACSVLAGYGLLSALYIPTLEGAPIQIIYNKNEFGDFFYKNFVAEITA